MDLSKLPKLSDTRSHTPPEKVAGQPVAESGEPSRTEPETFGGSNAQPIQYRNPGYRQPGVGVDIWISAIIGVLMLMLGGNFARWAIATARHQPFPTGVTWPDEAPYFGREATYFELQGFTALADMGIFLFGVTLLFEAAAKAFLVLKPGKISRLFLMLAIVLTLGTVLLNLYACAKIFNFGTTPLLSGLAVAFGGWVLFDEWATLKSTAPRPVPSPGTPGEG